MDQLPPDAIGLSELRRGNSAELFDPLAADPDGAMVVTRQGRPHLILCSITHYEQLKQAQRELQAMRQFTVEIEDGPPKHGSWRPLSDDQLEVLIDSIPYPLPLQRLDDPELVLWRHHPEVRPALVASLVRAQLVENQGPDKNPVEDGQMDLERDFYADQ